MKRLASWLRQIANELDPPAKRGRPSRAAERNAAAVDALFAESEGGIITGTLTPGAMSNASLSFWNGSEFVPLKGVSDLEIPQEPASCSKCGRAHGRRSCR